MALREDLEDQLNRASAENASNTPDFVLADYLIDCLAAFDKAVIARERWYGRVNVGPGQSELPLPDGAARPTPTDTDDAG